MLKIVFCFVTCGVKIIDNYIQVCTNFGFLMRAYIIGTDKQISRKTSFADSSEHLIHLIQSELMGKSE